MSKILLEKATLLDLKEVASLERNANSKTYYGLTDKNEILDFINNEEVFLIKKEGIVIGLIAYRIIDKKTVHINGLIVSPKFRGKGIAREAMNFILKKITKYSRVELEVHPHNTAAIRLYLSFGFIVEAWKDDCFGDGEPRLILSKMKV